MLVAPNLSKSVLFTMLGIEYLYENPRYAAEIGVERLVLDDGWFGARRSDRAGLGDWIVNKEVWPRRA